MHEHFPSPLHGAHYRGYVEIAEAGSMGMVTIRCDHADALLQAALGRFGLAVPQPRQRILAEGGRSILWMSPDELLLTLPHDEADAAAATLLVDLARTHALVVDVSEARVVFRVSGGASAEVMAKLTPADVAAMGPNEIRRSRLGQVAAAFWHSGDDVFTIIAFRSVAQYVYDLLCTAAAPGGEVG